VKSHYSVRQAGAHTAHLLVIAAELSWSAHGQAVAALLAEAVEVLLGLKDPSYLALVIDGELKRSRNQFGRGCWKQQT
jgi:hypothetical protein